MKKCGYKNWRVNNFHTFSGTTNVLQILNSFQYNVSSAYADDTFMNYV